MAITRQKKEEIVKKAQDIMKNYESVVFVNFHGLTVSDVDAMRAGLRKNGVGYSVLKKTLVKKVLKESGVEGEVPFLDGELALAYSEDAIAPAQGIAEYQKKHKDVLSALGGIFESRFLTVAEVGQLAAIPPKEVLYGQLVGLLNSPIQQTVGVMNNVVGSLVIALDQVAQKK